MPLDISAAFLFAKTVFLLIHSQALAFRFSFGYNDNINK